MKTYIERCKVKEKYMADKKTAQVGNKEIDKQAVNKFKGKYTFEKQNKF